MIKERLLLDTNAYLRLAEKLHPLLNQPFGPDDARLFVIREFEKEFKNSPRMCSKFTWVNDQGYVLNRKKHVPIPQVKRQAIKTTKSAIESHIRGEGLTVSPVDATALAIGRVLGMQVITDDKDMRVVAETFKIPTMRTLALLKRMLREEHIDIDLVREIAVHWQVTDDCPGGFRSDYRRYFSEAAPRP